MTTGGPSLDPATAAVHLLAAARRLRAADAGTASDELWSQTLRATALVASTAVPSPELLEATAALQWLSLQDPDEAVTRRAELLGLLGDRSPVVTLVPDGPLVVLGAPAVTDYLGRAVDLPPVV